MVDTVDKFGNKLLEIASKYGIVNKEEANPITEENTAFGNMTYRKSVWGKEQTLTDKEGSPVYKAYVIGYDDPLTSTNEERIFLWNEEMASIGLAENIKPVEDILLDFEKEIQNIPKWRKEKILSYVKDHKMRVTDEVAKLAQRYNSRSDVITDEEYSYAEEIEKKYL